MTRPPELACDDVEDPVSLDEIMKSLGAEVLQWGFKTECCGGSLTACRPKVGLDMTQKILDAAIKSGADCIVTACPMCHSNLDMRQAQLAKQDHNYHMPVFFITEMIGIALGMKQKDLGVDRHFIATEEVMCKLEEYEQEQLQKMMNEGGEA